MYTRRSNKLAKAVTLGLILGGFTGTCFESTAWAAANATQTVTADTLTTDGVYNSIVINDSVEHRINDHLYGIMGSGFIVTMQGDRYISVTGNADLPGVDQGYVWACGITSAAPGIQPADTQLTVYSDEKINMQVAATAKAQNVDAPTSESHAIAIGVQAASSHPVVIDGAIDIEANATGAVVFTGVLGENPMALIKAYALVQGLYSPFSTISITGDTELVLTARGGNAISNNSTASSVTANAYARAYGMNQATAGGGEYYNHIDGNATMNIKAIGGTATVAQRSGDNLSRDKADASAIAYGMFVNFGKTNQIGGDANITVEASGGQANCDNTAIATAEAYGLFAKYTNGNGGGVGINNIYGDAEINVTAHGGLGQSGINSEALAAGLFADGGQNFMYGDNFIITAAADVQTTNTAFRAYSLYAQGNSYESIGMNCFVNTSTANAKLQGDIVSNSYGNNLAFFNGSDSYLQGNIVNLQAATDKPYGDIQVVFTNDAVWRPVYDNRYGTFCADGHYDAAYKTDALELLNVVSQGFGIMIYNDGLIDLTWDGWGTDGTYDTTRSYRAGDGFRTLRIDRFSSDGGILKIDSNLAGGAADVFTAEALSEGSSLKVQINYDDFFATSRVGDVATGSALVVQDLARMLTVTGMQSEYNEHTYDVTIEQDATDLTKWNLVAITDVTTGPTENVMHANEARESVNDMWLVESNSLVKRLGDLRSMTQNANEHDSVWAKYGHGRQEPDKARTAKLDYNQYQVGYDKAYPGTDGIIYRGLMLSRIDGDTSYERGSGDTDSTTLGLYQTWVGNKGHYYDFTLRHGRINAEYNVTDLSDHYSTAELHQQATTLSGEYGYRYALGEDAYFEPSAELILGHVGSTDYTTSRGMHVSVDGTQHAVTRLGFALGKGNADGNAYVKANYYHDFANNGGVHISRIDYETANAKNWWEFGIGGAAKLGKNVNAYAEVRKLFGDVKSNVNYAIGARWSF